MEVDEAKTKICPFMGCVEKFGNPEGGYCITDKCMAWEFEWELKKGSSGVMIRSDKKSTTYGYCKRLCDA